MALKTFKPYTKSTRGTILVSREGLWKGKPFKSLTSIGSRFNSRHNSSTRLSTANAAIGDPGALYAADLGRLESTS